jgi:beta-lactamase superfamily II metal-dependent hydrolase
MPFGSLPAVALYYFGVQYAGSHIINRRFIQMDYEVEFLPVGDFTKAGDAIVVRYGTPGEYKVLVIDGGTSDSGDALVEHIKTNYGVGTIVDDVISTHPDSDHASGLRKVLELLPVHRLWVHGLWHHTSEITQYFAAKNWTPDGLEKRIRDEYPITQELIDLAEKQGATVHEPFQGETIGPFTVLSPNRWSYLRLIPQFRRTPDPDIDALKNEKIWIEAQKQSAFAALVEKAAAKITSWIDEKWDIELLKEGAKTAAENESSTVLYGNFGTDSVLLTADAGENALWWACNYAKKQQIDLSKLSLVQVPHHGSRSNVTPSALDLLLGPKLPKGTPELRKAIVSAPKDDESHPRKMVINAFTRRGAGVRATQGIKYRWHSGTMPARDGERTAVPLGFFDKVEEYD